MMAGVSRLLRSPHFSFLQTLLTLLLSSVSLLSSYWFEGRQKVPKPLCSSTRQHKCTPVPGVSNTTVQFTWETGDDRFIFPTFHAGLWTSCEENIHTDAWEEKCRNFMALTPESEKGIFWLCVGMELIYISLLFISCVLLSLQLCLAAWWPRAQRWGQLFNAHAAVFTVLAGLVGMVAHIMFMQVFQVTSYSGPEDFKPQSYGYSWAFYVAWVAFSCCMCSGVSTLNNYTKKVLMVGPKERALFYPCKNFTFPPQPSHTPYYCPPAPPTLSPPPPPTQPPPLLSPLSPYYSPAPCPSSPLPSPEPLPPPPHDHAPFPPLHNSTSPLSSPPAPLSPYYTSHPPLSPSLSHLHPPLSPFPSLSRLHPPFSSSPSLSHLHPPLSSSPSLSHLHPPLSLSSSLSHLHPPLSPSSSLSHLHPPLSPSSSLSRLHPPPSSSNSLSHLDPPLSPSSSLSLLHSPFSLSSSLLHHPLSSSIMFSTLADPGASEDECCPL